MIEVTVLLLALAILLGGLIGFGIGNILGYAQAYQEIACEDRFLYGDDDEA